MRTSVVVLGIAMLALPAAPLAQQREPGSPAVDAAATTATTNPASEPDPLKPAARRSLMGMVMATLIESAEQSARQASAPPTKPVASDANDPVPAAAAAIDGATADEEATASSQVAVQTVP